MKIVIPTNRPEVITLNSLPREADVYISRLDHGGIEHQREFINKKFAGTRYLVLDDDLDFHQQTEWYGYDYASKPFKQEDWTKLFELINRACDAGFVHGSLKLLGSAPYVQPFQVCGRNQAAVFFSENVPTNLDWHNARFAEDFYTTLQLLKAGYPNLVFEHYRCRDIKGTNSAGGCSTSRTKELHNAGLEKIVAEFKAHIKPANRRPGWNKITVDWKRNFVGDLKMWEDRALEVFGLTRDQHTEMKRLTAQRRRERYS